MPPTVLTLVGAYGSPFSQLTQFDPTPAAVAVEVSPTYAPFLVANAAALAADAAEVVCEIDGARWAQRPFPYQAKCLRRLREAHAALTPADRRWVDDALAGTGCSLLLEEVT